MDRLEVSGSHNPIKNDGSFGPNIAVVGVGGAGQNAVDNMLRLGLEGVDFSICNTDAQTLQQSLCPEDKRVCIGYDVTKGLGAGSSPEVGRSAAEESLEEVMSKVKNAHMLFITAGMGGGTGTGAAPVIARAAKELNILTIGVVTKPFGFEGNRRMKAAEKGIEEMKQCVNTLIVVPNQNLFRLATDSTTFAQAFAMADEVLYSAVRTFTDLMVKPGLVNLDFADIQMIMKDGMCGMIGAGEESGENRAIEAAKKAMSCPLIEDVELCKAKSVLIQVAGGMDMTLYEVDEAAGAIKQEVDQNANIIFGSTFDEKLEGLLRVSVVAAGIEYGGSDSKMSIADQIDEQKDEAPNVETTKNYDNIGSTHLSSSFDERHFSSFSAKEDPSGYGESSTTESRIDPVQENFFDVKNKKKVSEPRFSMLKKIATLGRSQLFRKYSSRNSDNMFEDNNEAKNLKQKNANIHNINEVEERGALKKTEEEISIIPAFLRQDKKKRNT